MRKLPPQAAAIGFSKHQLKKLVAKLDRAQVHTREIDGKRLDYIEGWFAMAEANRIFGFAGWDREMVQCERLYEHKRNDGASCAWFARVRVRVRAADTLIVREGTGFGQASAKSLGEAYERALKTAETDATKRALATFGNRFGLALYDKDQNGVTASPLAGARPTPSKPNSRHQQDLSAEYQEQTANCFCLRAPTGDIIATRLSPEGFCSGLRQLIEACSSSDSLQALAAANRQTIAMLREEAPNLISRKGEHFADILERLMAKRIAATAQRDIPNDDVHPPETDGAKNPSVDGATNANSVYRDSTRPREARRIVHSDITSAASSSLDRTEQHIANDAVSVEDLPALSGEQAPSNPTAAISHRDSAEPFHLAIRSGNDVPLDAPNSSKPSQPGSAIDKSVLQIAGERRIRSKAHLRAVAAKPCLICEDQPSHAHHITFAQPRGLSIKVSDEFTVPLCAVHHNELHRSGQERQFWHKYGIEPLSIAATLWQEALLSAKQQQAD